MKDMAYHLINPYRASEQLESSQIFDASQSILEPLLSRSNVAVLIRRPELSIPSKYRVTGQRAGNEVQFCPEEIGYRELRLFVEWWQVKQANVSSEGVVSDTLGTQQHMSSQDPPNDLFIVEAEDLLDNPTASIARLADRLGLPFSETMLSWTESNEDDETVRDLVHKYADFHKDVFESKGFGQGDNRSSAAIRKPRTSLSDEFGEEGAQMLQKTIDSCKADFTWLRQRKVRLA